MRIKRGFTLFLVLLFALAIGERPAAAQQFEVESFMLGNGMQVVVLPNRRVPAVTQTVWYRIGAADDPRGKSGLAHFLEHLMFKGTRTTAPGEFSKLVAQAGGRDNAFTGADYTGYHQTVASDRLELLMRLEADRMTGLVLDDSVVLPERDVVLEERRMRVDNDPSALLREQLTATLFLNGSYRVPTVGWESEIRQLGTEDALAFYRQWYAPNNAILVVTGDVDTGEVRRLAEKYFGPIPPRPLPERVRLDEPPHRAAARLEMKHARVAQPSWRRLYLAPSYHAGDTRHAYALQVLAEILGGGAGSRLHQELVLKNAIALNAGAGYAPNALGLTTFWMYAVPKTGIGIADLEAAVEAQLRSIAEQGVEPDEVERAAQRLRAAAIYARDSLGGPANIVGAALVTGQTLADVAAWPDRIAAVTPAQIQEAARSVFVERNSVTGVLLPERTS
ncbi:MAG: M16 family metallopeptidase [Alphaproteobacteria bacterium]